MSPVRVFSVSNIKNNSPAHPIRLLRLLPEGDNEAGSKSVGGIGEGVFKGGLGKAFYTFIAEFTRLLPKTARLSNVTFKSFFALQFYLFSAC
jgi:hypothetical protein